MPRPLPSQEELHALFDYSSTTGLFTYKTKGNCIAGSINKVSRYRFIRIKRILYKASRLAWMYVYGEDPGVLTVDHIDRDKSNDAIDNLRLATRSQQNFNRSKWGNSTGIRGVYYNKKTGKYLAQIQFCDKRTTKQFDTAEEAQAYYNKLRAEHGGEFAA